ncbi:MAG: outer membrane protein assembly factor BamB family protein [Paracoccaceae bacterium]
MRFVRKGYLVFVTSLMLLGCAEKELILPGERENVRETIDTIGASEENKAAPIRLSAQVNHSQWTHRAGNADHYIQHAAFSGTPRLIWATKIGEGNDRKHRISADPVAAAGRIFTLDSRATVAATSTSGALVWTRDLTPADEKSDDASGGGLAVVSGVVYVTTGFGDLVALDAATGNIIWKQSLAAAATGAPTVSNGVLYLVTRDARAWAINTKDGRIRWQLQNAPSVTGVVGGAAPAVDGKIVVFPFGSVQLTAAFRSGGFQLWTSSAAGARLGRVYANITDITGDPVLRGGKVYVGNPSGRTVALDSGTGERIWTAGVGAVSPVWVDGGSVFLVSDRSEIVRLNAATGAQTWAVSLPDFVPTRKVKKRRDIYPHYGPVLAGGRLWVASGDGLLRGFDPVSGAMVSSAEISGGASSRPIVVNGVMYIVTADGKLLAFR